MYFHYRSSCAKLMCVAMLAALVKLDSDGLLTPNELADIDGFMENIMQCRNIPGLTLSVVKEGKVLTRAYGKADITNDINATADSIFCLGSLTKAFTVALLSSLLPEKYPQTVWDTPVKDILGEWFRLVDNVRTELTTVKDLLAHRTGLTRGDFGIYAGYPDTISREYMVRRLFHLPARHGFREKLVYNNWMYMLAGYIAEVLADGESWDSLLKRKILHPLGMNSTVLLEDLPAYLNQTLAVPYRVFEGGFYSFPLENYRFHPEQPAGAICSTGSDMAKWLQFLLNIDDDSHSSENNNVVNISAYAATKKTYMASETNLILQPEFPASHVSFGAGQGWFMEAYRGHRQVNHNGALLASSSLLWTYPDLNMGIFIASNRQARDSFSKLMAYYVSDMLLGETPWLNYSTSCTFPEPWQNKPIHPNTTTVDTNQTNAATPVSYNMARPGNAYIGTYGNRLYGDMVITMEASFDNRLRFEVGVNMDGLLFPEWKRDLFSLKFVGLYWFYTNISKLQGVIKFFENEDDGEISSLLLAMNDEIIAFNRTIRFEGPEPMVNVGGKVLHGWHLNIICFYLALITIGLLRSSTGQCGHINTSFR